MTRNTRAGDQDHDSRSPGTIQQVIRNTTAGDQEHYSRWRGTLQQVNRNTLAGDLEYYSMWPGNTTAGYQEHYVEQATRNTTAGYVEHYSRLRRTLQQVMRNTTAGYEKHYSRCPRTLHQVDRISALHKWLGTVNILLEIFSFAFRAFKSWKTAYKIHFPKNNLNHWSSSRWPIIWLVTVRDIYFLTN